MSRPETGAASGRTLTAAHGSTERESPPVNLICPTCRQALVLEDLVLRCVACDAAYQQRHGVWQLALGRLGAPGYDPHYFGSLPQVEERHFWFLSRRALILDVLRKTVPDLSERPMFDVGCGSGGLAAYLAVHGVRLSGASDAYPEALRMARSAIDAPLFLVDEGRLPPLGPGQTMVGLFDVLEHIDDDVATLSWIAEVLEPGGFLVLTVPAHPALYNDSDRAACHRRRYRRTELRRKLTAAGLRVRRLTHFMAPLAPAILISNWWEATLRRSARRPSSDATGARLRVRPGLNMIMGLVLGLERRLLRRVSLPFGSSLIAVAERPHRGLPSKEGRLPPAEGRA